jgi:hypothetical protein
MRCGEVGSCGKQEDLRQSPGWQWWGRVFSHVHALLSIKITSVYLSVARIPDSN